MGIARTGTVTRHGESVELTVSVRNAGQRDGAEVVLSVEKTDEAESRFCFDGDC